MNDTGNVPFWELNAPTVAIAALTLIILIVCVLAYLNGRR